MNNEKRRSRAKQKAKENRIKRSLSHTPRAYAKSSNIIGSKKFNSIMKKVAIGIIAIIVLGGLATIGNIIKEVICDEETVNTTYATVNNTP